MRVEQRQRRLRLFSSDEQRDAYGDGQHEQAVMIAIEGDQARALSISRDAEAEFQKRVCRVCVNSDCEREA